MSIIVCPLIRSLRLSPVMAPGLPRARPAIERIAIERIALGAADRDATPGPPPSPSAMSPGTDTDGAEASRIGKTPG
jgi:hypothetical protein